MEEIIEPNEQFPFDKLTMLKPTVITGGNYFIKFQLNGNSLYIQPPKCVTKQGIAKAGKKLFCDFVYKNENETFIQWIEKLENFSQKKIFDNREKWFESELNLHDIENSFTSPLKIYKSGKSYILRTNIPTRLGKCSLKIYDETENDVDPETIKDNTQVITILEFQGIRCSVRSFQIEIEVKQMMILQPSKLFEKCILTTSLAKPATDVSSSLDSIQPLPISRENIVFVSEDLAESESEPDPEPELKPKEEPDINRPETEMDLFKSVKDNLADLKPEDDDILLKQTNELTEFELVLDDVHETVQLRNRKDVYYKMYREAKTKAKLAKDLALSSYLEAKRIKNTYMLDDVSDSDESYEEDEEDEEDK